MNIYGQIVCKKNVTMLFVSLLGPFPVLSLMVGSAVMRLVPDPVDEDGTGNYNVLNNTDELTIAEQRVLVAASVTVLVGIFQVSILLM